MREVEHLGLGRQTAVSAEGVLARALRASSQQQQQQQQQQQSACTWVQGGVA